MQIHIRTQTLTILTPVRFFEIHKMLNKFYYCLTHLLIINKDGLNEVF